MLEPRWLQWIFLDLAHLDDPLFALIRCGSGRVTNVLGRGRVFERDGCRTSGGDFPRGDFFQGETSALGGGEYSFFGRPFELLVFLLEIGTLGKGDEVYRSSENCSGLSRCRKANKLTSEARMDYLSFPRSILSDSIIPHITLRVDLQRQRVPCGSLQTGDQQENVRRCPALPRLPN